MDAPTHPITYCRSNEQGYFDPRPHPCTYPCLYDWKLFMVDEEVATLTICSQHHLSLWHLQRGVQPLRHPCKHTTLQRPCS